MSAFNRFCAATKRTAKKIVTKTEGFLDTTATAIKIRNLEMRIDEQYENLGRVIYRDLHTDDDLEEEKLQIIAAIDALFDRIAELKATTAPAEEAPAEDAPVEDAPAEDAPAEEAPAEDAPAEDAE